MPIKGDALRTNQRRLAGLIFERPDYSMHTSPGAYNI